MRHLIRVRDEPEGQFTAEAVGIPEARATESSKWEAVKKVTDILNQMAASGKLFGVDIQEGNPVLLWAGWAKDDPEYQLYLEEIARYRREVDERDKLLQENGQECRDTSSTPTT